MKKSYETPEIDWVKISFEKMLAQIKDSDIPDPAEDGNQGDDD